MTTNPTLPLQSYVVAGLGPYSIPWPYATGTIVAKVIDQWGAEIVLSGPAAELVPGATETSGNLFFEETGEVAALHAGKTLQITRAILTEQGWTGLSSREKSLETGLDALTRIAQDAQGLSTLQQGRIAAILATLANMGAPGAAYELNFFVGGALSNGVNVYRHVFASAVQFPVGLIGSWAKARVASAASNVFSIRKNAIPGGTITFAAGATGIFALPGIVSFASGDVLEIWTDAAAGADALRDVAFVIKGTRT